MIPHSKRGCIPATIVCNPAAMGGTRIPVEMILVYLRAACGREGIFEDYPGLPFDGIETVIAWADENLDADWRKQPAEA